MSFTTTGMLGFFVHLLADLDGPSMKIFDNIVHGAPPFAPLLFPNLVLLSLIALWVLRDHVGNAESDRLPQTGAELQKT